jgi:nicotinate-nucleotide pyrophosphorylase
VHDKSLVDHVVLILRARNILQQWRMVLAITAHLGGVRQYLQVHVHIVRKGVKVAETPVYVFSFGLVTRA